MAISPDCELWASSNMTAYVRSGSPAILSVTCGNFCNVVMLIGVLVDFLHDSLSMLELVDRILELVVQHAPVRDDDDAIEDFVVGRVVQARQSMGQPTDRVAL